MQFNIKFFHINRENTRKSCVQVRGYTRYTKYVWFTANTKFWRKISLSLFFKHFSLISLCEILRFIYFYIYSNIIYMYINPLAYNIIIYDFTYYLFTYFNLYVVIFSANQKKLYNIFIILLFPLKQIKMCTFYKLIFQKMILENRYMSCS